MLLEPPLLPAKLSKEEIAHELKECCVSASDCLSLKENAQSILGYVVRWIDLGIGCSKVPDLSNVGLMEDRATLRISSQLLQHDLVSEDQVRDVFLDMAKLVDQQNAREPGYIPMSLNPEHSPAFQAAMKLVLEGRKAPNGYTEYTLHEARRSVKEQFGGGQSFDMFCFRVHRSLTPAAESDYERKILEKHLESVKAHQENEDIRVRWRWSDTLLSLLFVSDISTEDEKLLGAIIRKTHDYSAQSIVMSRQPFGRRSEEVRPFYTMPDPHDEKWTNAYDVFLRGEEITSGAQRIHDPKMLTKKAEAWGVPPASIQSYIDAFKYGSYPHAGAGIGMERVLMLFLNLNNIRKVSMFPRDPKRLTPTSRREHRAIFEAAAQRFRQAPFQAPPRCGGCEEARGIRVCVRKRPIFPHEIEQGEFDAITCLDPGRVVVHDARMHPDMVKLYMNHHDFDYDEAFDEAADNRMVYEGTAKAIVEAALEGQNGTVMMCHAQGVLQMVRTTSHPKLRVHD
eukprot:s3621_g1.t1